jgi:DNA-binding XRE family transcriptional regulator
MSQTVNLDVYLTRAEAALALGVSKDTISAWHARGWHSATGEHLRLATKSGKGNTFRYRYGDLLQAETDTRNSPQSRRPTMAGFLRAA